MVRRILIAGSILIGMCIVLFINWPGVLRPPAEPAPTSIAPSKGATIGGAFALTDTNGNSVTEAALQGHYSLVYFGFTHCPDICPITLQKMTEAITGAGSIGENVTPVFITVDPANDTPDVMKAYVGNFHPRFLALTGTPEAVKQAENAYHIYANKADGTTNVVHSDAVYLMDASGKYVTQFDNDATVADITDRLRREVKVP